MSSFIHIVPVCSPGAQIYLIVVPVFAVFVVTVDTNQIITIQCARINDPFRMESQSLSPLEVTL